MKLWIDGQCFQSASRMRGIGRYAIELIRAISISHPEIELHISLNSNAMEEALLAFDLLQNAVPSARIHSWHGIEDGGEALLGQTTHRTLSQFALQHYVACLQPDVALSISPFEGMSEPYTPFLPPQNFIVPTAAIFYDAIPKRLSSIYLNGAGPKMAYDRRFNALSNFDGLLAISEYSKEEANELVGTSDTINIGTGLHHGFLGALEQPVSNRVEKFVAPHRTSILYVGGLDHRKNLPAAIEAVSNLDLVNRSKVELLIVGAKQTEELNLLTLDWARTGLRHDQLKLFGYASDEDLAGLYLASDIVIQPSLLEGFGLTALEALAAGTPVVASNTGALPEVVGDERLLFDPSDVGSITSKLQWAIENKAEVHQLAENSKDRARNMTWERVASKACEALKALQKSETNQHASVAEIRRFTAKSIREFTYHKIEVATTLAAAEPTEEVKPRFLVDITSTARIDHKSGIQRVVRKMCEHLTEISDCRGAPLPYLIGTDKSDGFFPTRLDGGDGDWDENRELKVVPAPNDTVLMLDSSWEFYSQHEQILRNARINGTKIVSVLYDLVPAMTPAFCDPGMPTVFVPWLKSCLSYSDGIVCISKAVADELISVLEAIDFPRSIKIGFWHLGADFSGQEITTRRVSTEKTNKFLSVGTIEPRKGHEVILAAFERLWAEGHDVSLTIVGRMGWGMDNFVDLLQNHPEFDRRLIWHSRVNDEQLNHIYAESSALIAASYGEGFGLPIIEASHHKLPVIASNLEVFKEVSGGSKTVSFFETGNSESLKAAVQELIKSPTPSAEEFVTHALTWKQSAEALHEVIWNENWYHMHTPRRSSRAGNTGYFSGLRMTNRLETNTRAKYSLEILGEPKLLPATRDIQLTFRARNMSEHFWAHDENEIDEYGISLAGMLLDEHGELMGDDAVRSPVTFVVPPGGQFIQSLLVPIDQINEGATSIMVDLLQTGVGVFGQPIEVSLIEWMEDKPVSDREAFSTVSANH